MPCCDCSSAWVQMSGLNEGTHPQPPPPHLLNRSIPRNPPPCTCLPPSPPIFENPTSCAGLPPELGPAGAAPPPGAMVVLEHGPLRAALRFAAPVGEGSTLTQVIQNCCTSGGGLYPHTGNPKSLSLLYVCLKGLAQVLSLTDGCTFFCLFSLFSKLPFFFLLSFFPHTKRVPGL